MKLAAFENNSCAPSVFVWKNENGDTRKRILVVEVLFIWVLVDFSFFLFCSLSIPSSTKNELSDFISSSCTVWRKLSSSKIYHWPRTISVVASCRLMASDTVLLIVMMNVVHCSRKKLSDTIFSLQSFQSISFSSVSSHSVAITRLTRIWSVLTHCLRTRWRKNHSLCLLSYTGSQAALHKSLRWW